MKYKYFFIAFFAIIQTADDDIQNHSFDNLGLYSGYDVNSSSILDNEIVFYNEKLRELKNTFLQLQEIKSNQNKIVNPLEIPSMYTDNEKLCNGKPIVEKFNAQTFIINECGRNFGKTTIDTHNSNVLPGTKSIKKNNSFSLLNTQTKRLGFNIQDILSDARNQENNKMIPVPKFSNNMEKIKADCSGLMQFDEPFRNSVVADDQYAQNLRPLNNFPDVNYFHVSQSKNKTNLTGKYNSFSVENLILDRNSEITDEMMNQENCEAQEFILNPSDNQSTSKSKTNINGGFNISDILRKEKINENDNTSTSLILKEKKSLALDGNFKIKDNSTNVIPIKKINEPLQQHEKIDEGQPTDCERHSIKYDIKNLMHETNNSNLTINERCHKIGPFKMGKACIPVGSSDELNLINETDLGMYADRMQSNNKNSASVHLIFNETEPLNQCTINNKTHNDGEKCLCNNSKAHTNKKSTVDIILNTSKSDDKVLKNCRDEIESKQENNMRGKLISEQEGCSVQKSIHICHIKPMAKNLPVKDKDSPFDPTYLKNREDTIQESDNLDLIYKDTSIKSHKTGLNVECPSEKACILENMRTKSSRFRTNKSCLKKNNIECGVEKAFNIENGSIKSFNIFRESHNEKDINKKGNINSFEEEKQQKETNKQTKETLMNNPVLDSIIYNSSQSNEQIFTIQKIIKPNKEYCTDLDEIEQKKIINHKKVKFSKKDDNESFSRKLKYSTDKLNDFYIGSSHLVKKHPKTNNFLSTKYFKHDCNLSGQKKETSKPFKAHVLNRNKQCSSVSLKYNSDFCKACKLHNLFCKCENNKIVNDFYADVNIIETKLTSKQKTTINKHELVANTKNNVKIDCRGKGLKRSFIRDDEFIMPGKRRKIDQSCLFNVSKSPKRNKFTFSEPEIITKDYSTISIRSPMALDLPNDKSNVIEKSTAMIGITQQVNKESNNSGNGKFNLEKPFSTIPSNDPSKIEKILKENDLLVKEYLLKDDGVAFGKNKKICCAKKDQCNVLVTEKSKLNKCNNTIKSVENVNLLSSDIISHEKIQIEYSEDCKSEREQLTTQNLVPDSNISIPFDGYPVKLPNKNFVHENLDVVLKEIAPNKDLIYNKSRIMRKRKKNNFNFKDRNNYVRIKKNRLTKTKKLQIKKVFSRFVKEYRKLEMRYAQDKLKFEETSKVISPKQLSNETNELSKGDDLISNIDLETDVISNDKMAKNEFSIRPTIKIDVVQDNGLTIESYDNPDISDKIQGKTFNIFEISDLSHQKSNSYVNSTEFMDIVIECIIPDTADEMNETSFTQTKYSKTDAHSYVDCNKAVLYSSGDQNIFATQHISEKSHSNLNPSGVKHNCNVTSTVSDATEDYPIPAILSEEIVSIPSFISPSTQKSNKIMKANTNNLFTNKMGQQNQKQNCISTKSSITNIKGCHPSFQDETRLKSIPIEHKHNKGGFSRNTSSNSNFFVAKVLQKIDPFINPEFTKSSNSVYRSEIKCYKIHPDVEESSIVSNLPSQNILNNEMGNKYVTDFTRPKCREIARLHQDNDHIKLLQEPTTNKTFDSDKEYKNKIDFLKPHLYLGNNSKKSKYSDQQGFIQLKPNISIDQNISWSGSKPGQKNYENVKNSELNPYKLSMTIPFIFKPSNFYSLDSFENQTKLLLEVKLSGIMELKNFLKKLKGFCLLDNEIIDYSNDCLSKPMFENICKLYYKYDDFVKNEFGYEKIVFEKNISLILRIFDLSKTVMDNEFNASTSTSIKKLLDFASVYFNVRLIDRFYEFNTINLIKHPTKHEIKNLEKIKNRKALQHKKLISELNSILYRCKDGNRKEKLDEIILKIKDKSSKMFRAIDIYRSYSQYDTCLISDAIFSFFKTTKEYFELMKNRMLAFTVNLLIESLMKVQENESRTEPKYAETRFEIESKNMIKINPYFRAEKVLIDYNSIRRKYVGLVIEILQETILIDLKKI